MNTKILSIGSLLPPFCVEGRPLGQLRRMLPLAFCGLLFVSLLLPCAHAAQTAGASTASGERGEIVNRQTLRSRVNSGGPEDWPEDRGLSTVAESAPSAQEEGEPSAPGGASGGQGTADAKAGEGAGGTVEGKVSGKVEGLPAPPPEKEEQPSGEQGERPVVYVDEHGNPVPKPVDPAALLEDAERLMRERKYAEALASLREIRELPSITPEQREKILYHISDCVWFQYADNPLAGFEPVVSATSEAMNANLRSPRVPDALLRLGLANLNVGNLTDAGGYIVALYRRYPEYPGVAQGFTALGKAQLEHKLDAQAEQSFSIVLDKFPESSSLQEASVGLAYALSNQKKHANAQIILGFISKRWPRYYIDQPSFLFLQADNDLALGNNAAALAHYWLYYNLIPTQKGNDALLLKMGDMYFQQGNKVAADFLYEHIRRFFPGDLPAALAELRLAEQGIYVAPINYDSMSQVFARAGTVNLEKLYTDIAALPFDSPELVLAGLKKAMWLYWNREYAQAMGKAADFIDAWPENSQVPQARDLIWAAFQKELVNALAEKNYGRILLLWNGFPLVRERYGAIDPQMRFALSKGMLEAGQTESALSMLAEFLKAPMDPQYGEAAFTEFFFRYLQAGAWDRILDLADMVSSWPLATPLRTQLDYAMALSAQNLNLAGPALDMWRKLAQKEDIPLYQRAYATYFLAQDAEQRKDISAAYDLNRGVVDLFSRLRDERSDKSDPQRVQDAVLSLMDICEVGNRIPEALDWLEKYSAFVSRESQEYPGLRFREARLYRKLGDAVRAQALLEDIVRNYGNSPFAGAAAAELRTFEVSRDLRDFLPGGARQGAQGAPPSATPQESQPSTP